MNNPIEAYSPERFRETAAAIEAEVGKVIVGQKTIVRHVLLGLLSNGHVLLEGVPGLGKTMLIRSLGQALALSKASRATTPSPSVRN